MGALFVSLLTLVLILISAFVVLLVLMQRTSQSGGMGAALGGGATESAFGSDTTNVLTKATIYSIIAFFVVSLGLFLIYQSKAAERKLNLDAKELISTPETVPSVFSTDAEAATGLEDVADAATSATDVTQEAADDILTQTEGSAEAVPEAVPEK